MRRYSTKSLPSRLPPSLTVLASSLVPALLPLPLPLPRILPPPPPRLRQARFRSLLQPRRRRPDHRLDTPRARRHDPVDGRTAGGQVPRPGDFAAAGSGGGGGFRGGSIGGQRCRVGSWGGYGLCRIGGGAGGGGRRRGGGGGRVVLAAGGAVDVAQVAVWVDGVADAALELRRLGEAAVGFAVPEDAALRGGVVGVGVGGGSGSSCCYLDDENAARRGLESDFAEGGREGG